MAIFLLILKIIGIILLSVLGLIIALILMVLFVPIRYRLKGVMPESGEGTEVIAKVTYLFHIISVCFAYKDKKPELSIRILGIPIRRNKDDKKDNKKRKKNKKSDKKTDESEKTDTSETISQQEQSSEHPQYTIETWEDCQNSEAEELNGEAESGATESEQLDSKPDNANGFLGKIYDFIVFVKDFCKKIYQTVYDLIHNTEKTIRRISSEVDFYSRYAQDERNKKAFSKCIIYLKKILKSIKPRRIKGNMHLGMDDPASTGQVLMYLSLIYPVMPRKLNISPDFENKVLEGNINIKGRILVFVLLWSAVSIYFDRDVKRALRIMKRHRDK